MMNVCVPNKILSLEYPSCIKEYKAYSHRDSKNEEFDDTLGFKWEWNNRSSKHIPFDWSSP
jgi:hypothetical protein